LSQPVSEAPWTFCCYQDERRRNKIHLFLKGLDRKALMDLRRTLQHLRSKPIRVWSKPQASFIINHIYVIRFKSAQGQFRLFGHHDSEKRLFIITGAGVEKDDKYDPPNYADVAVTRMGECKVNPKRHVRAGLDPDAEWNWKSLDTDGHFTPRLVK
jgi:hypothetical protein